MTKFVRKLVLLRIIRDFEWIGNVTRFTWGSQSTSFPSTDGAEIADGLIQLIYNLRNFVVSSRHMSYLEVSNFQTILLVLKQDIGIHKVARLLTNFRCFILHVQLTDSFPPRPG